MSSSPRRELAPVLLLGMAAGSVTWLACSMLMPAIAHVSTFDYWFESDAPAVLKQLHDRLALDNERANRHPLFTLVVFPVFAALRLIAPHPDAAAALAYSIFGGMWAAGFFLVLRQIGLQRREAALFTGLAFVTSAAMFWLPVPETFTPAALTLLVAIAAAAWHEKTGRLSWSACVLVSAITLSMTVTNVVAGVLLCVVVLGVWRGATAVAASLAIVAGGQFVARLIFPHTAAFFLPKARESAYAFNPLAGSLGDRLAGFFLHDLVLPPLQQGYAGYLSVQQAGLTAAPVLLVAWCLWTALLVAGGVGIARRRTSQVRVVLLGVLASQLALVLVFGQETFVYALQSTPLLVLLAAFGCFSPWRRWVLAGTTVLVVVAAAVNGSRFVEAATLLDQKYTAARRLAEAVETMTRPSDLIVLGLSPAAAEGRRPSPTWVVRPGPLTRLPAFDEPVKRQGWQISFEQWSPDLLEELRRSGAHYFVSDYPYGLRSHAAVMGYLETHARAAAQTPNWVIYALHPPGATTESRP